MPVSHFTYFYLCYVAVVVDMWTFRLHKLR